MVALGREVNGKVIKSIGDRDEPNSKAVALAGGWLGQGEATVSVGRRRQRSGYTLTPGPGHGGFLAKLAVGTTMILAVVEGVHFPAEGIVLWLRGVGVGADEGQKFAFPGGRGAGEPHFRGMDDGGRFGGLWRFIADVAADGDGSGAGVGGPGVRRA